MAGTAQEPSDTGMTPQPSDPGQALSSATSSIRQAESSILAIAQQFPQAAPEVRRAREAIRAVLQKIVSQPGGAAPAAPRGEV